MLSPLTTSLVVAGIALVLVAIAFGVARLWWPTAVARRLAVAFVGGAGFGAIATTVAIAWSLRMSARAERDTYELFPLVHAWYTGGWAGALLGGLLLAWLAARRRP